MHIWVKGCPRNWPRLTLLLRRIADAKGGRREPGPVQRCRSGAGARGRPSEVEWGTRPPKQILKPGPDPSRTPQAPGPRGRGLGEPKGSGRGAARRGPSGEDPDLAGRPSGEKDLQVTVQAERGRAPVARDPDDVVCVHTKVYVDKGDPEQLVHDRVPVVMVERAAGHLKEDPVDAASTGAAMTQL